MIILNFIIFSKFFLINNDKSRYPSDFIFMANFSKWLPILWANTENDRLSKIKKKYLHTNVILITDLQIDRWISQFLNFWIFYDFFYEFIDEPSSGPSSGPIVIFIYFWWLIAQKFCYTLISSRQELSRHWSQISCCIFALFFQQFPNNGQFFRPPKNTKKKNYY